MNRKMKWQTYSGLARGSIACLIALAMISGLAGCSRSAPTAGPTPTQRGSGLVDDASGQAIITFAIDEWSRSMYEPLAEEFNTLYPDITVQLAAIPEYGMGFDPETYNYARTLASTADTAILWGGWSLSMGAGTYFRDLGPLIDSDPSFQADDFWPGILSSCEDAEGRVIGIPISGYLTGIYYDEQAFQDAGIPKPAPGWTWEDFNRAVSGLYKTVGGKVRYGFADRVYFQGSPLAPLVDGVLYNSGGEIEPGEIESVVQWYIDLVQADALYPIKDMSSQEDVWQEWQNLFADENRPAMWVGGLIEPAPGGDGMYFSMDEDPWKNMAISTYGFAPFPVGEGRDGGKTTPLSVQCVSLSAGSQNPRAAWAWVDFLSRQYLVRDQNQIWELQQAPARQSVAEKVGYFEKLPAKAVEAAKFGMSHGWPGSLYPVTLDLVGQGLAKHIAGDVDLNTALADAMVQVAAIPQPTPDTNPVVVSTPQPPPPADATVINFYSNRYGPYTGEGDPIKALAESYAQSHPDIFVKLSYDFQGRPDEDTFTTLSNSFDCFSWYEPYFQEQAPEGLLGLSSLLSAEGSNLTADFNPTQLDSFRYEGELYGLPVSSQTQIMSYNADLLARGGFQPPSNDWTFADFVELLESVSSAGGANTYGFLSNEWDDLLLEGRGVKWADLEADPPQALFDTPEMLATVTWLADLINSGALLVQRGDNWEEISNAFGEGRVGFWLSMVGEPWGYYMPYGESPPNKIGVAPVPQFESTTYYGGWTNTIGLFISNQAQDPQACWDWIKYLSESPTGFPGVPARRSVNESAAWEAQVGADYAEVYRVSLARVKPRAEMMETSVNPVSWPFYSWRSEIIRAVIGGEQPGKALDAAQRKAEDYLACASTLNLSGLSDEETYREVTNCAKQADPEGMW